MIVTILTRNLLIALTVSAILSVPLNAQDS